MTKRSGEWLTGDDPQALNLEMIMPVSSTSVKSELVPVEIHTHHPHKGRDGNPPKRQPEDYFAKVPIVLLQAMVQADLSRAAILVAIALISYDKDGYCYPSHEDISFRSDLSVASVRRGLKELELAGFLTITPQGKADKVRRSCTYQVVLPTTAYKVKRQTNTVFVDRDALVELEGYKNLCETGLVDDDLQATDGEPVPADVAVQPVDADTSEVPESVIQVVEASPEGRAIAVRQAIVEELRDVGQLVPDVVGPGTALVQAACSMLVDTCGRRWRDCVRHTVTRWAAIREVLGHAGRLPSLDVFLKVARIMYGTDGMTTRGVVDALENQFRVQFRPRDPVTFSPILA